jgi:hypothetical protein
MEDVEKETSNLLIVEKGQIWADNKDLWLCPVVMVIDNGERIVYEHVEEDMRSMTIEDWHKSMVFFAEEE